MPRCLPYSASAASTSGRRVRDDRRNLRARLEQARGLAVNDLEIAHFRRVRVAGIHQLQHLAGRDRVGRIGHHADHFGRFERRHHLEGARVQEIADQHRGGVAKGLVRRIAAAALGGIVHDVVVQEGRRVDEFDQRSGRDVGRICRTRRARGQQNQQRPQALAARAHDVIPDLADERDIARELTADFPVNRGEVGSTSARMSLSCMASWRPCGARAS